MKHFHRNITLIFSFLLSFQHAICQEIISPCGDFFNSSNGSVCFTVGEPVSETLTEGSNIITQGFIQSNLIVSSVNGYIHSPYKISSYPNPATDQIILNIENDRIENYSFQIYDINGKVLLKNFVTQNVSQIPFSIYKPSTYILNIFKEDVLLKTFKIIKK